jgi:hypothetical protein
MKSTVSTLTLIILFLTTASCDIFSSSDEEEEIESNVEFPNGIHEGAWDFITQEILDIIEEDLEMPIHRGDDPPQFDHGGSKSVNVQSDELIFDTYLISPVVLLASTVPDDPHSIGSTYPDTYIRIYNQDLRNHTVSLDVYEEGIGFFHDPAAYIMGSEGYFTIMSTLLGNYFGHDEIVGSAFYSGYLGQEAIADLHYNYFMIDNASDDAYIPNNSGRSMRDDWGVSELTTWPENAAQKSPQNSTFISVAFADE